MTADETMSRGTDALRERHRSDRVASVRTNLAKHHVSPEIIDRVIRLNPRLEEGAILRGIHYTSHRDSELVWMGRCLRKGAFIRKHGAEAWRGLPRRTIRKRGRREYVAMEAVQDRLWLAA